MYYLLYALTRLAQTIADYCNDALENYLYKRDAKAEEEYNKLVTDFYENGIGYYGEK